MSIHDSMNYNQNNNNNDVDYVNEMVQSVILANISEDEEDDEDMQRQQLYQASFQGGTNMQANPDYFNVPSPDRRFTEADKGRKGQTYASRNSQGQDSDEDGAPRVENMEEKLSGMSKSISIEKPREAESLDAESNSLSQLQKQLANRFVEVENLEQ